MGGIRDDFGNITIESRRESFYIHANYGYVKKRYQLDQLRPGAEFFLDGKVWKVTALFEEGVQAREQQFSTVQNFLPSTTVEIPEGDVENADGPFAEQWRERGAPEFLKADLDDLIAALQDYKESL